MMMTNNDDKKIISILDLVETKVRKEQEIARFEAQLKDIEKKLFFLRKEKELTETILYLIERENILDLREYIRSLPPKI